jgi:hypothetical protein
VVVMSDESSEPGNASMTRRERLERIANAERDRRAGLREVAIATIGQPVEWPARVVLALALLDDQDGEPRRLLEEGLDLWARDAGLGELGELNRSHEDDADVEGTVAESAEPAEVADAPSNFDPLGFDLAAHPLEDDLESPVDLEELDRAFAEAEADVESMHNVNEVAERVLLDEPVGFDELAGEALTPVDEVDEFAVDAPPDNLGMDAAYVAASADHWSADERAMNETEALDARRRATLATLESWLHNLQDRRAGRA